MSHGALDPERLDAILTLLEQILSVHPAGISEYDLLHALDRQGDPAFSSKAFSNTYSLFTTHFLLFHALHRLRLRLLEQKRADLSICCTCIVMTAYTEVTGTLPEAHDPLQEYYFDLDNVRDTTEEDVRRMLDDFWTRYEAWNVRGEALAVLGLQEPVDLATVKRRYHELALEHHPDRGGDKARLQQINAAMSVIKRALR